MSTIIKTKRIQNAVMLTLCISLFTGCSTLTSLTPDWQNPNISLPNLYQPDHPGPSLYHKQAANMKTNVNAAIQRKLPKSAGTRLEIIVKDGENLIDGQSLAPLFGARYFPSPRIKASLITANTGIRILRPINGLGCEAANPKVKRYVLSVTVSDYDDKTRLEIKGNNPFADDGGFEADFDAGNRSTVDTFKLKSELVNCATGEVLLPRETSVSVTSTSQDNSVYLFAKVLGWYYRHTLAVKPGLNTAKDIALDAFLSGIFMELAGVTPSDMRTAITPEQDP